MNTEHICPSCRKPLPEGAPSELCPECLIKAGFPTAGGQPGGKPKFVAPSVAELAKLFPQLEVLELIGQGGMGAVYRARQPALDRLVAIKILPPDSTADPGFAERFAREARALAKLNHPNIVGVYDFGQGANLHYFIMEYVDGLNLRQLKTGGRLSAREALEIIPQMCDALQFAHDEGIVHRDIKPENVMVDKRGRVKITDFGLAKLLGLEPETLQLTGVRDVMGTPHYMAPEQIDQPQTVDHRADIYSLGVVFYELLTGELPIGKFAPPSRKVAVDVRLDEVVLHTLEREPDRRYQHASQVKTDVETITHTPRAAQAPSMPPPEDAETAGTRDALAQVKGPATGLVITAILNWLGIPLLSLIAVSMASRDVSMANQNSPVAFPFVWFLLPLLALVLSAVIMVAGLKMKRLQSYWLAVAGSILAILVTPGNLVGLPVGIWSLVVLSQLSVRRSFGKELPWSLTHWASASTPSPGGSGWKLAAVVVAIIFLIAAIPVGMMVLAIALPALHRAKARAQIVQVERSFAPAREVTVRGIESGGGDEALDLDSGRLIDIPAEVREQRGNLAMEWLAKQGADVMLERVRGQWGLLTAASNELQLSPAPEKTFLLPVSPLDPPPPALAAVIAQTIRRGPMVVYVLSTNAHPPLTFWYETANGGKGLLRVVAFGEEPDHAKLQFRRKVIMDEEEPGRLDF